jgi:hypothetical protein
VIDTIRTTLTQPRMRALQRHAGGAYDSRYPHRVHRYVITAWFEPFGTFTPCQKDRTGLPSTHSAGIRVPYVLSSTNPSSISALHFGHVGSRMIVVESRWIEVHQNTA